MTLLVSPIVTYGYGDLEDNVLSPVYGYGELAEILAPIVKDLQGGALVPSVILKKTLTTIRFDITNYQPLTQRFIRFVIGHHVVEPIELIIDIDRVRKATYDILVHHLNFKLASNLSRIVTGSKDIRIQTNDKNIP